MRLRILESKEAILNDDGVLLQVFMCVKYKNQLKIWDCKAKYGNHRSQNWVYEIIQLTILQAKIYLHKWNPNFYRNDEDINKTEWQLSFPRSNLLKLKSHQVNVIPKET